MKALGSTCAFAICIFAMGAALVLDPACPSSSLWGSKAMFVEGQCSTGYWQLAADHPLPALRELSVCVALRRRIIAPQWTAFVYKRPGASRVELGLAGSQKVLRAWLLGKEHEASVQLPLDQWYSLCLTWSGKSRRLQLFVNGSCVLGVKVNETDPELAGGGTLTLGASHGYVGENFSMETGNNFMGEISHFRVWGQERGPREMLDTYCVEGDVVRWDACSWDDRGCPALPDASLTCAWAFYKIQMQIGIVHQNGSAVNVTSAKTATYHWLNNTFPNHISVRSVSLSSSLSQAFCNKSGARYADEVQGSSALKSLSGKSCFDSLVHVSVSSRMDVKGVQDNITRLLRPPYSHQLMVLTVFPRSVHILPVDFPAPTDPPTTMTAEVSTVAAALQTTSNMNPVPDFFYRVTMSVTVFGMSHNLEEYIWTWLQDAFSGDRMVLLNYALLNKTHSLLLSKGTQEAVETLMVGQSRCSCRFQVQAPMLLSAAETEELILARLTEGFANRSVRVHTQLSDILISRIEPGSCPPESQQTRWGLYLWPLRAAQQTAALPCEGDPTLKAARSCLLNGESDQVEWSPPDLRSCPLLVSSISDLDKVNVTANNSVDVVVMIDNLTSSGTPLSPSELDTVLDKLAAVVKVSQVTPSLGEAIVSIIGDLLESHTDLQHVANSILSITDAVGDKMSFPGESHNTTAPSLALSLVNVDSARFCGLSFTVASFTPGDHPQVFLSDKIPSDLEASVHLPPALDDHLPQYDGSQRRIQFQFYGIVDLFHDPQNDKELCTYVVSASIRNASITNLQQPINVTLRHSRPIQPEESVTCVYWDFQRNGGQGGWDTTRCWRNSSSSIYTTCLCDHLTHFAVLLDLSRSAITQKDEHILTFITYLGCGISSIFLGISVLTYTAFEALRRDYPSKILINLALALLGLNLDFLVNSWMASLGIAELCVLMAASLHYFLLASFTWMGLEAVHMYLALVRVFSIYVPSYLFKLCLLGWGLPLVIVALVLAVDKDAYGQDSNFPKPFDDIELFCWLRDDVTFYVSVVAYVFLVLLCNSMVFVVVLYQIRILRAKEPAGSHGRILSNLRGAAGLSSLLGLTWTLAFFTWGPVKVPLLYLFSVLNTLQGFFIFLFYCLMKENVRKQWRIHLFGACCQLKDYSDWSHSATCAGKPLKNPADYLPKLTPPKSDTRISTCSTCSLGLERNPIKVAHAGIVSLVSLSILSYERYSAVLRSTQAKVSDFGKARLCVAGSWLYALLWSLPPFLGWSSYGPEGAGTTCSVQWHQRTASSISYVVCLFIFCLLLPLVLMVLCYSRIFCAVRGLARISLTLAQRRESHVLVMVVSMVTCYLLCWMPYGVVALVATFGKVGAVSPLVSTVPSVLAKSSTVFNPIIYVLLHSQRGSQFYRCFVAFVTCGAEPSQPKPTVNNQASSRAENLQPASGTCPPSPRGPCPTAGRKPTQPGGPSSTQTRASLKAHNAQTPVVHHNS